MSNKKQNSDISDKLWALLEPHLPGQKGSWGGIAKDNRLFINGVFWILKTGAPWRELPSCYGKWSTVYQRFRRWRDKGIWEEVLEILIDEPDFEWLLLNVSYCNASHYGAKAKGSRQNAKLKEKRILKLNFPWMYMICSSEYLSHKIPELIAKKLST